MHDTLSMTATSERAAHFFQELVRAGCRKQA